MSTEPQQGVSPPPPLSSITLSRNRRWSRRIVLALFSTALVIVAANVLVDPFSIFGLSPLKHGVMANERFNKAAHLLENIEHYDGLILGSSRMGVFSPAQLEAFQPDVRYYNLGFMGATPAEYIDLLEALERRGMRIKHVLLGIDMYSFHELPVHDDPATRHHPAVTGQSLASYYVQYAFTSAFQHLVGKMRHHWQEVSDVEFDFQRSGQYFLRRYDREIRQDHDAFIQRTFSGETALPSRVVWLESGFETLRRLVDRLEANGTHVTAFVHPFHPDYEASIHPEDRERFSRLLIAYLGRSVKLLQLDDKIDFEREFYDRKHYRESVAHKMLDSLVAQPAALRSPRQPK